MSNFGRVIDPFIAPGVLSGKMFNTPLGHVAQAAEQMQLMHQVQETAKTVDIGPGLQQNSYSA